MCTDLRIEACFRASQSTTGSHRQWFMLLTRQRLFNWVYKMCYTIHKFHMSIFFVSSARFYFHIMSPLVNASPERWEASVLHHFFCCRCCCCLFFCWFFLTEICCLIVDGNKGKKRRFSTSVRPKNHVQSTTYYDKWIAHARSLQFACCSLFCYF